MPNITPFPNSLAWPVSLALAAIVGTLGTSCMMPFVAIAVAAATTMSRPQAIMTLIGIWAINQILGFGLLGYPLTAFSLSWGGALGMAGIAAHVFAAMQIGGRRLLSARLLAVFAGAFVLYETMLYGFALVAGGTQTFTAAIIAQIFVNEVSWFAGLIALHLVLTRAAPGLFGASLKLKAA